MLAQPDWFGLIFAFAILLLTLDYRFEKLEPGRFVLIFLATAAIILSRRWYLYFVVGYYFSYALLLFGKQYKARKTGPKRPCPAPSTQPHPVWCLRHGSNGGPALAHGQQDPGF